MKLIFVFINRTKAPYGLKNVSLSNLLQNQQCGNWLRVQISSDQELWIHDEYEPEKREWEDFQNALNNATVAEIYIGFHATWIQNDPDARQKIIDKLKGNEKERGIWPNSTLYSNDFSRLEGDRIWRSFSELILAWAQNAGNSNALFEDLAERIKKKLTPEQRLGILKHRIAHLFLPIDIDLQGLMETDFREDYWQEVVEAWKDRKDKKDRQELDAELDALNDARRLIYGEDQKRDTVEKVLKEAGKQDRIGSVEKLLPRPNSTSESEKFSKVKQILKFLGEGNKEELRELFKSGNPFHCWLKELESALDNLRKEVEQGG
jgi:hypothetical protein